MTNRFSSRKIWVNICYPILWEILYYLSYVMCYMLFCIVSFPFGTNFACPTSHNMQPGDSVYMYIYLDQTMYVWPCYNYCLLIYIHLLCTRWAHVHSTQHVKLWVNTQVHWVSLRFFSLCLQKPFSLKHGEGPFEVMTNGLNGLHNYVQPFCTDFRLNCRQVWIIH